MNRSSLFAFLIEPLACPDVTNNYETDTRYNANNYEEDTRYNANNYEEDTRYNTTNKRRHCCHEGWIPENYYHRASKIPKCSLYESEPSSCLDLSSEFKKEFNYIVLISDVEDTNFSTNISPCSKSSKVEKKVQYVDLHKRTSFVSKEDLCRPKSIASPQLVEGFQDMTTRFSRDSGFSSTSSANKSSLLSIPSSPSVEPKSSPCSIQSLNSLKTASVLPHPFHLSNFISTPKVPPSTPYNSIVSPLIISSTAGRHSTRNEELFNPGYRNTHIHCLQNSVMDGVEDIGACFRSMTIDRKCLRDKAIATGKKTFNLSPSKGIEFMIHGNLVKRTPEGIAEFLFRDDGIKKSSIGEFIGEGNKFNIDVLKAFVNLHNFKNMTLVQALRRFLWSFRLPGESQKIDRIMEHFSSKYCSDNPFKYSNSDTCFVLSFAVVMLNTSLHNNNVRDKLTPEKFESMVKVICQDIKVTGDQLLILYKSIKKEPLRFPEESGPEDFISTFFNPTKEGWLFKKSEKYNQWKKRWFVMSNGCLYYFTYRTDQQPRAILPLENLIARKSSDKKKEHCLEIVSNINSTSTAIIKSCKIQNIGKLIEGSRTKFKLAAYSTNDCQEWIDSINKDTYNNPLQKLIVEKKSKILLRSQRKVT